MRVHEGTSYEMSNGTWQKPEVELDDADFERAMAEWGVEEQRASRLPLLLKYSLLSALGRQMLISHQIQSRLKDEHWVQTEGAAQYKAVGEELQKLYTQVKG